ncbi:MAG: GspE/PulE family protein [Bacillota bacterium]
MSVESKKKMGDILIEKNIIDNVQLEKAMLVQNKTGERLGQVLIKLGFATEEDIINVLGVQLGVSKIKLNNIVLMPDIIKMVPEKIIRQHRVVPVRKVGNRLTVAINDPLNVVVLDDLHIATGCEIEPVLATEKDIDWALQKLFGFQDLIKKAARAFDALPTVNVPTFNLNEVSDVLSDEAPTIKIVNSLIHEAVKERASDIHIEPQSHDVRIRYRIDGVLRDVMVLPKQWLASIVSRIKIMADMDIAEKRIPLDGRIQVKVSKENIDLRISSIPTVFGEKVVIRILDKSAVAVNLDQLGFSPEVLKVYRRKIISRSNGMVLITGPTGSGKTTTLYSTLNEINTPEKNIITIEDPVEYVLENINQIKVNNKAGLTFPVGLRAILRQDPDIIMVGEIRDNETARIAVRAATTGHLVFSTLHTNDAAGALPRLIDMEVEPFLVASSVIAVLAQRLVRVICPGCKNPYQLPDYCLERNFLGIPDQVPITLYRGTGCPYCAQTGYLGRMMIQELLPITQVQRNLINTRASAEEIKHSAVQQGMVGITQDGIQKVLIGLTTIEEVMRVALMEG